MALSHRSPFAGRLAVALLAIAMVVGGCRRDGADPQADAGQGAAAEPDAGGTPVALPQAMNRSALLGAVRAAASAAAIGQDDSADDRKLDGRQFEVRIRFGCSGPATDLKGGGPGYSVDSGNVLRVRAAPTLSAADPLVQRALAGAQVEAVEGFWIPRPWLLSAACPVAAPAAPPAAAEGADRETDAEALVPVPVGTPLRLEPVPVSPRVGLAQFYTSGDKRTGRRDGRAFEATQTLPQGSPPIAEGLDLVLSGRLRALPGRRVILCAVGGPEAPPECVVSAQFDRVWIERPGAGTPIAEWTTG